VRILKITDVYHPRVNGVSTSIRTFRNAFLSRGHKVILIAPDYDGRVEEDDPDIIRIPARSLSVDPEDRVMRLKDIKRLAGNLRKQQFDIIHIHTPFVAHYAGVYLARELQLPVVETYHTYFEEYLYNYIHWLPRNWLRSLARMLSRAQCNKVNTVVVPSRPMFDMLRKYGVLRYMNVIPTGIDLDQLVEGDGRRFRAEHGIDADRPTMLFIGRLAFEKNVEFLLDVLIEVRKRIPDMLLILAGEGPARTSLVRRIVADGLQDNVLFVGYLPRGQALNDCYCAGDVFVFASETETQGLVLLEAMALGVPVVSTAVMGTVDVLHNSRGCLVARPDIGHFASRVVEVLTDPFLGASLSDTGTVYATQWSALEMADRMLKLYALVIDRWEVQTGVRQHQPGAGPVRAISSENGSR
jgi:glycosyltransferase involved in cell wall biosynthesis